MTAPRDPRVFLADIIEYAEKALRIRDTAGSMGALGADELRLLAITRALEVVGEAAKGVPLEVRAMAPSIPWQAMAGMRDRLIHAYHDVDLEILWQAVAVELPRIVPLLTDLLSRLNAEAGAD